MKWRAESCLVRLTRRDAAVQQQQKSSNTSPEWRATSEGRVTRAGHTQQLRCAKWGAASSASRQPKPQQQQVRASRAAQWCSFIHTGSRANVLLIRTNLPPSLPPSLPPDGLLIALHFTSPGVSRVKCVIGRLESRQAEPQQKEIQPSSSSFLGKWE